MNRIIATKLTCSCFLAIALVNSITAQTVIAIHSFDSNNGEPSAVTPEQGRDGTLYGTTAGLPAPGGSIFRFRTSGTGGVIHVFDSSNGFFAAAGVNLATDGNYYGTTQFGGSAGFGVLFKVTPSGTYTVLHEFVGGSDGSEPYAPPIEASDGNLYGTTSGIEGINGVGSTIYKYNLSGAYSTIYQFNDSSLGAAITAGVIQAQNGNLYGTAQNGGANNCGTIFEITRAGVILKMYSFPCGGGGTLPGTSLIQAADGNFYGTTFEGGSSGLGTIFKLDQQWHVSILYSFVGDPTDARIPSGLTQGTDGNLYGEGGGGTNNEGALFRITTGGTYTLLYSFSPSAGEAPGAALLQHTNGLFYGTTERGGANGTGTVYSLNMGLGPFVTFVLPAGKVGHSAQILGQGLTGATSVTFNGIAATSFKVASDTFMTAVVPSGATTGKVVVTTPGGNLTSNVSFRISQ